MFHLQLDNARGSNKNTYVWGYVTNLVERGVFRLVYVSFLPVGHTHFGPDRIASRISVGVRYRTVLTLAEFHDLIRRSHTPAPLVEQIDVTADWRLLMNPQESTQWTGARIKGQAGICTIRPCSLASMVDFVSDTSSLHWRFSLDSEGRGIVQDRQIDDVNAWSAVTYPFQKSFQEDNGNGVVTGELQSGITRTTLPVLLQGAPNKPIPAARAEELTNYINDLTPRLREDTKTELLECVDHLSIHREGAGLHWADEGLFRSEMNLPLEDDEDDEDDDEDGEGFAALANMSSVRLPYDRPAIQESATQQASVRGQSLANPVHVDDFIAYKPYYVSSTPEAKRKSFYVGRVTALYPQADGSSDEPYVQIQCFQTTAGPKLLLDSTKTVKYKKYNRAGGLQDVFVKNIFIVFKEQLPDSGSLPAAIKRDISRELATRASDPERSGVRCASG